jgi:hypothetical protein
MIINYPDKYTDFKLFFLKKMLKICTFFIKKLTLKNCLIVLRSECLKIPAFLPSNTLFLAPITLKGKCREAAEGFLFQNRSPIREFGCRLQAISKT